MPEPKNHAYRQQLLRSQKEALVDARWTNITLALLVASFGFGVARWFLPGFDTPIFVYVCVAGLAFHALMGEWLLWKWVDRSQSTGSRAQ